MALYHELFWLGSSLVALLVIVLSLVLLFIFYHIDLRWFSKKLESELNEVKKETRFWRNTKIIAQIFVYSAIGFIIILAVGFGKILWEVGTLLIFIIYSLIFANVLHYYWRKKTMEEGHGLLPYEEKTSISLGEGADDRGSMKYYGQMNTREYLASLKKSIQSNNKLFAIGIVVILIASFLSTLSSECMCVAVNPVHVSTRWSRITQNSVCHDRVICHLYLTMADSTDLIVNYHSTSSYNSFVAYDVISHNGNYSAYQNTSQATTFKMSNINEEARHISWAEMKNLTAGSTYYFVVVLLNYQGNVVFISREYKLRTIPENDNFTYNFVSGGDMSSDSNVVKLTKLASATNPYFAMIGGDVAYDDGFATCYRRWDEWFENWNNNMVTQNGGFLVPAILAVGNHEAGGFGVYGGITPFFSAYFPQQIGLQGVDPFYRVMYHSHRIGKQGYIVVLDSGVINSLEDQVDWLEKSLSTAGSEQRNAKFVLYHSSVYASVPSWESEFTNAAKQHWTPVFDRHNVTAVFENHLHVYKRTKPLRGDKVTTEEEGGVVYLGDGSWGVNPQLIPAVSSWYMEVMVKKQHVYSVQVNSTHVLTNAVGMNGIFDTWQRNLETWNV